MIGHRRLYSMMGALALLGGNALLSAPSIEECQRRDQEELDRHKAEAARKADAKLTEPERNWRDRPLPSRLPHQGKKEMARRLKRMRKVPA